MILHSPPAAAWPSRLSGVIQEEEVHIWTVSLKGVPLEYANALDEAEQNRALRYHFERDRQRFIASRIALRRILGEYLELEPAAVILTTGSNGKPALQHDNSTIRFNLSHSDGLMLLALTSGSEVGVDVERVRDILELEMLLEQYFDPADATAIGSIPPAERTSAFLHLWTRTEACLKADGVGIVEGLRVKDPERWSIRNFSPAPGYVAAVALDGRADFTLSCRS